MKLFKLFLKTISTFELHFLPRIKRGIFLDQSSKSNYAVYNDYETEDLYDFISKLDGEKLYSVIPMISIKPSLAQNRPYIVLSQSILITRYSNHRLLASFIHEQRMNVIKDFDIKNIENHILTLKYKKVFIDHNVFITKPDK